MLKEDWKSITKIEEIEKKVAENANSLQKISVAIDKQIDSKPESMRNTFEKKLDNILTKQVDIPQEIKTHGTCLIQSLQNEKRSCEKHWSNRTKKKKRTRKEKQMWYLSESLRAKKTDCKIKTRR